MLDINTITEFSRNHCVAICAFLVPANLIATLSTMILAALHRPLAQVRQSAIVATFFAVVMIMHVCTWLMIGVVQTPTYILLWLAITCLFTNLGAFLFQRRYIRTYFLVGNR
ncbi:MAG: hypothetical protein AAFY76_11450 [Cyanobacteria bacterium J06649_11]|nr:hypothetical protein [Rivularia sp. ALOHA_DT_140]